MLKKSYQSILLQAAAIACTAQLACAGNVSVNLNLGTPVVVAPPPTVYVPAPEPVYVPAPEPVYVPAPQPVYVPAPQPVYTAPVEVIQVEEDIQFVYPNSLGFYVAVGIPYDLFYINNSYFLYRDGRWLRAPSSRGPWVVQRYRELPPGLRRHRVERIREYRNREYAIYRRDRDHYRGRHFRSEKEQWREHRREAHARKEERRYDKEQRKESVVSRRNSAKMSVATRRNSARKSGVMKERTTVAVKDAAISRRGGICNGY